ncbi:MAG: hypothetical protein PHX18_04495 [Candidatus Gastranaerophilales bacterium]|nr:hypothetical protein [Candidatus Gastranaerophilales bacterium]
MKIRTGFWILILILTTTLIQTGSSVMSAPGSSGPVKIEVSSRRIPEGTVVPLKMESTVSSITSSVGDQFNASITEDIILGDNIILPAGSMIRGTVGKVKKANLLVKGARILLFFDHIVTPVGKQVPLYAYITDNPNVNYEGDIVSPTSYGKEFKKDASKSKAIIVNSTKWGVDTGLEHLAGVPVVLTAPVGAIGGSLGGSGFLVGKSIYNIFKKGGDIVINPGQIIHIKTAQPLDIPVN